MIHFMAISDGFYHRFSQLDMPGQESRTAVTPGVLQSEVTDKQASPYNSFK